jgi:hypothetical protein
MRVRPPTPPTAVRCVTRVSAAPWREPSTLLASVGVDLLDQTPQWQPTQQWDALPDGGGSDGGTDGGGTDGGGGGTDGGGTARARLFDEASRRVRERWLLEFEERRGAYLDGRRAERRGARERARRAAREAAKVAAARQQAQGVHASGGWMGTCAASALAGEAGSETAAEVEAEAEELEEEMYDEEEMEAADAAAEEVLTLPILSSTNEVRGALSSFHPSPPIPTPIPSPTRRTRPTVARRCWVT